MIAHQKFFLSGGFFFLFAHLSQERTTDENKIREEILSLIAQHVKAVNHIYSNTLFDGKDTYKNIRFEVQRIKVKYNIILCDKLSYQDDKSHYEKVFPSQKKDLFLRRLTLIAHVSMTIGGTTRTHFVLQISMSATSSTYTRSKTMRFSVSPTCSPTETSRVGLWAWPGLQVLQVQ